MSDERDIVDDLRHVLIPGGYPISQARVRSAADVIDRLRSDLTDKATAWDAIAKKNAEIASLRAQLHNAIQKHIDCDAVTGAELISLRAQDEAWMTAVRKQEEELVGLRAQLAEEKAKHALTIQQSDYWRQIANEDRMHVSKLEAQLASVNTENDRMQAEIKQVYTHSDDLMRQLASARKALEEIERNARMWTLHPGKFQILEQTGTGSYLIHNEFGRIAATTLAALTDVSCHPADSPEPSSKDHASNQKKAGT